MGRYPLRPVPSDRAPTGLLRLLIPVDDRHVMTVVMPHMVAVMVDDHDLIRAGGRRRHGKRSNHKKESD